MRAAIFSFCIVFLAPLPVPAAAPTSIETGRDVGDGQVLYDTPYDPRQVDAVTFVHPTVRHPYYEIVVPLGDWTEGRDARVTAVRVGGLACQSYYVFVDGFSHVQSPWLTQQATKAANVVLVARMLWHDREQVTVEADISAKDSAGKAVAVTKTASATAPPQGGGPAGWRRYQSLVLHERAGLAREGEPVEFSLAARAENCGDLARELRLWQFDSDQLQSVPLQTFSTRSFPGTPPGTADANYLYHASRSIEGVFLASVPAHESRVYVLVYDNPAAQPPPAASTDLVVRGPALGATVENRYFIAKLDDKCGQIASFQLKGRADRPAPLLQNSHSFAAHWNPDSYSDNGKWGHTFSWDPPDRTVVAARGPILFRVTNSGRMPEYTPQVRASVSYSFYASTPYVKVTTVTEVRDPLNASAIRNGELVLDTHLVTHFVWQEKTGGLKTVRTAHGPNWQDEWSTRVDHDVPWIAMTNEPDSYGVGAVVESSLAFNATQGEATRHRPAYYLYYHHMWGIPLTYFTRAWVYPFSDYQRGPIMPVQPGSTYVEKTALMPFFLDDGDARYAAIQNASRALKNPLAARWGR